MRTPESPIADHPAMDVLAASPPTPQTPVQATSAVRPQPLVMRALHGERQPLQGEARLLGTSGTYSFVHWLAKGRAEAIANETIGRIEVLLRRLRNAARREADAVDKPVP